MDLHAIISCIICILIVIQHSQHKMLYYEECMYKCIHRLECKQYVYFGAFYSRDILLSVLHIPTIIHVLLCVVSFIREGMFKTTPLNDD